MRPVRNRFLVHGDLPPEKGGARADVGTITDVLLGAVGVCTLENIRFRSVPLLES